MTRVLITRAEPEASATASLVQSKGAETFVFPLTSTESLAEGISAVRGSACDDALMIVTSVRAIDVLEAAGLGSWIVRQRWAVVGERAAARLRALGAPLVGQPAADVSSLIALLSGLSERLIYLCAVDRKDLLETQFPALRVIPVYQAKALGGFSPDAVVLLNAGPPTHALVYSARGARLLAEAVVDADLEHTLRGTHWLCLSEEIAANAPSGATVAVAHAPTQEALLALLP